MKTLRALAVLSAALPRAASIPWLKAAVTRTPAAPRNRLVLPDIDRL